MNVSGIRIMTAIGRRCRPNLIHMISSSSMTSLKFTHALRSVWKCDK